MNEPRFCISRSSDNQYYFNLIAGNNEKILTSELYTKRDSAVVSIASVRLNATEDARYERKISRNGDYYFVLKAANGEVLGTSELYPRADVRDAGIEAVKRNVVAARIEG